MLDAASVYLNRLPHVLGIPDYDTLGPNDGTAMFVLLPDCPQLEVRRRSTALRVRLDCAQQPISIGVWRNLNGYPWDGTATYRNFGIEPMLGHAFNLDTAGDHDAATLPATGSLEWTVTITFHVLKNIAAREHGRRREATTPQNTDSPS